MSLLPRRRRGSAAALETIGLLDAEFAKRNIGPAHFSQVKRPRGMSYINFYRCLGCGSVRQFGAAITLEPPTSEIVLIACRSNCGGLLPTRHSYLKSERLALVAGYSREESIEIRCDALTRLENQKL